jgi:O-antigen ligase
MAVVNGVTAAAGGLLFFVGGDSLGPALEINPNAWAYFPLTALFSICLAASASPRTGRLVLALLAVVNFAWVFLTGSRGSLVLAGVCMAFLAVRLAGAAPRIAFFAAAALCALLLSGAFGQRESYALSRIGKLLDPEESLTERTSGRSDLARAAWRMFLDRPMLGMGTGGFASRWSRLQDGSGISSFGYGREMQAHSAWMKTLAENGLPGFLLLAAFVLSFAVSGWKNRARGLLAPGLLVSAVLALALVSTEFQSKGLWLLCAGGVTLLRGPQRERAR